MNFRHAYLIAFAISIAVIAYEDIHQCHRLPWPPRLIGAGLVFGLLSLFSAINEELAGVLAIGMVLAILVNKGFINDCQPHTTSTVQPTQSNFLADTSSPISVPPDTGYLAGTNLPTTDGTAASGQALA